MTLVDHERCEYADYRGDVCGATREQHISSTHLFTRRGVPIGWTGPPPKVPLLVLGLWTVFDSEGRPLAYYGPDEAGRRAALLEAIDVPGATIGLTGPRRAEVVVP